MSAPIKVTATQAPSEPPPVVLTMPHDVAVTLLSLIGNCAGGLADGSTYRTHTGAIYSALKPILGMAPVRFVGHADALKFEQKGDVAEEGE